jgi:hypothetical protein
MCTPLAYQTVAVGQTAQDLQFCCCSMQLLYFSIIQEKIKFVKTRDSNIPQAARVALILLYKEANINHNI